MMHQLKKHFQKNKLKHVKHGLLDMNLAHFLILITVVAAIAVIVKMIIPIQIQTIDEEEEIDYYVIIAIIIIEITEMQLNK